MLRLRMLACGTMISVTSMVVLRLAEYPSVVRLPPNASASSASLKTSPPIPSTTMLRLSALGLRRDPHGSVKQIYREELEDGDKERPAHFPRSCSNRPIPASSHCMAPASAPSISNTCVAC